MELSALPQCPACEVETRVVLFPAFDWPFAEAVRAELVVLTGEATCFYHPQKRAHVPCDACGRFLCALCDLDVNGAHLCPQCLETGAKKSRLPELERERTRWDRIVSTLLFAPLVLCWVLLPLTSLVALVVIGWKWKAPPSLVSNTRISLGVYAAVAVLQFGGSVFMWWLIFAGPHTLTTTVQ
ncbi:MAG: hypothetical protein HY301_19385 [Verrucomicrobia bacterium]|nr:hypothetical protein [Verrucomicrobiota bacterium]